MNQLTEEQRKIKPQMDWQQVVLNGGPPCFYVEGPQFCGRAERWPGHGNEAFHDYVSLEDYVTARVSAERAAQAVNKNALDEIESALLSIANGASPQVAVGQAFNVINSERVRLNSAAASPAAPAVPQPVLDHIMDKAIGCRNCGDTWERAVAADGTVAPCEDCGDGTYSLIVAAPNEETTELLKLRQAIGWICDAADAAYIEDSNNERIHEIFNIAAQAAGLTRRLPDEHQRFDETSTD